MMNIKLSIKNCKCKKNCKKTFKFKLKYYKFDIIFKTLITKKILKNNELAELKLEGSILLDNGNIFNLNGISQKENTKFLYDPQNNSLLLYQDEFVTDNCNIMIFDQIGRVLLQKNINLDFGINEIPLENILSSSGVYFAKVSHSNGQNSIQKILYAQP